MVLWRLILRLPRDDYFWLTRPLPGRSSFSLEPNVTWKIGDWNAICPTGNAMAIYRLIAAGHFGPDEIAAMTKAYEAALTDLRLVDRHNPLTELIARSIVIVTGTGERNPEIIKGRALTALGISQTAAQPKCTTHTVDVSRGF